MLSSYEENRLWKREWVVRNYLDTNLSRTCYIIFTRFLFRPKLLLRLSSCILLQQRAITIRLIQSKYIISYFFICRDHRIIWICTKDRLLKNSLLLLENGLSSGISWINCSLRFMLNTLYSHCFLLTIESNLYYQQQQEHIFCLNIGFISSMTLISKNNFGQNIFNLLLFLNIYYFILYMMKQSKFDKTTFTNLTQVSPKQPPPQTGVPLSKKFIPQQFKNKHLSDSPVKKQLHRSKHDPDLKTFKKNSLFQDKKDVTWQQGQKIIQQNFNPINKKSSKKFVPYLKEQFFPKLRQTNSTQCQSPKANSCLQYSRLSEFKIIRKLGKGRFGDVFLVKHLITGMIAALKIISKQSLISENKQEANKSISQFVSQIKIQSFLHHPNLISIYDCFSDECNVYLLMELATDGHLYNVTSKGKCFSEEGTSIIIRQVTEGIREMHKKCVIHRDIKLENIVLCMGMVKICDFGWSAYCPKEFRSTLCGTPLYLSPQMLIGKAYNKKVDIWAIGSIAHELATSKDPFQIKSNEDLSKIITEDFEMQFGSPQLRSFVNFILKKNPTKRPDADTVLMHPFIEKYKDLETSQELCRLSMHLQQSC